MFYSLLALVGFIAIWCFIEKCQKDNYNNGDKLKKISRKYFYEIRKIIELYQNTEFAKKIINNQEWLDQLEKSYNGFKKTGCLKEDDLCKLYVENANDDFFVQSFALVYVYSFDPHYVLYPGEEERHAVNSIKQYCKNKIELRLDSIPDILLDNFGIDKNKL